MHSIVKLVARIHEATHKWLVGELAAAGLKSLAPSHGDVLACLFMHGEATMHERADFVHRMRPTMTVLVDKMEAAGLVMRIPHKDQPQKIIEAVGAPEGYTVPCMIGIGYAADSAEIPTQVFPKIEDCVHWQRW